MSAHSEEDRESRLSESRSLNEWPNGWSERHRDEERASWRFIGLIFLFMTAALVSLLRGC